MAAQENWWDSSPVVAKSNQVQQVPGGIYVPPAPPAQVFLPPTFGPPEETPPTYYTSFGYPNIITGNDHHHDTAPVPEPNTLVLFGAGLGFLAFFGRRR